MKVLITNNYFLKLDPKQWKSKTPYPPLGTLYAASFLQKNDFDVVWKDLQFETSSSAIHPLIEKNNPDIMVIYEDGFNYLSKMCLSNMREEILQLIRYAKGKNIPVVISASDASDHSELYLNAGADVVIYGEGEITLLEYLKSKKESNGNLNLIDGLRYLKDGRVFQTKERTLLKDLDFLPDPAWHLLDILPYKSMWLNKHGFFSINLVTTRGCPFKCNWCAKPIYGNRYHCHSPERIANQMKVLKDLFNPDHIWFADDIFGLKPEWIEEFSKALDKLKIKIPYKIQSRADLIDKEKTVLALASSGCETVWMGAESGSQKILDAMDKGTRIEQIKNAAALLKKHQIKTGLFLQFGYPGEELADIQKTIQLVNEINPDDIGISVSYPLPGTPFYEKVKNDLKEKQNWTDSDDLAMMFQGNYSPEFYRNLHRFVHPDFRYKSLLNHWKNTSLWQKLKLPYYKFSLSFYRNKLRKIQPDAKQYI